MSNILEFKNKKQDKITEVGMELTKEDYEFLEDMIANSELAMESEVDFECDDGFCITKSFDVKVSPKQKDYYNYLQSKNTQKRNKHLTTKRKQNLTLVK